MRRKTAILVNTLLTLGLLELILRLVEPREIFFETWTRNGIHTPDPDFGFRYTPGYDGFMRHSDGVYAPVPLRLNRHGFRLETASPGAGPDAARVLLLGGKSMMFSYGLSDEASIPGRMAALSPEPLVVQNAATPGVYLYLGWHVAREQIEAFDPDIILLNVYQEDPALCDPYAPAFDRLPPPPPPESMFRLWDRIADSRGALLRLLGRQHDASYLLYGLFNVEHRLSDDWSRMRRWVVRRHAAQDEDSDDPAGAGFTAFFRHIDAWASARNCAIGVVLLPEINKPPDRYAQLRSLIPPEIRVCDAHAALIRDLGRMRWIGEGHYGPEAAERIGRLLVDEAIQLNAARLARGRPSD